MKQPRSTLSPVFPNLDRELASTSTNGTRSRTEVKSNQCHMVGMAEKPPRAHQKGQRDRQSEQSDAKPSTPRYRVAATFAYAAPNDIAVDGASAVKREVRIT